MSVNVDVIAGVEERFFIIRTEFLNIIQTTNSSLTLSTESIGITLSSTMSSTMSSALSLSDGLSDIYYYPMSNVNKITDDLELFITNLNDEVITHVEKVDKENIKVNFTFDEVSYEVFLVTNVSHNIETGKLYYSIWVDTTRLRVI